MLGHCLEDLRSMMDTHSHACADATLGYLLNIILSMLFEKMESHTYGI